MIYNYIKVAVRSFLRDRLYSLINVLGLSLATVCVMFIMLYVWDELRYDNFHTRENIYRVALHRTFSSNDSWFATTPVPMAEVLQREYAEVNEATRLFKLAGDVRIRVGENIFYETSVVAADSNFFSVFSFPLVQGNAKDALLHPNSVVLTRSAAERYFGDEDPLGRSISVFSDTSSYMVTGVVDDLPSNSHIAFDLLLSFVSFPLSESNSWASYAVHNYVVLDDPASKASLEAKFPELVKQYFGPQVYTILGKRYEEYVAAGNNHYYHLQPVEDIHLRSNYQYELQPNSDIRYVYLFSVVAVFILFIAAVNFTNLSIARSFRRAKEIGVRKVQGSTRLQIVFQFLAESTLSALVALLLAGVGVVLLLPSFNDFAEKSIRLAEFPIGYAVTLALALAVVNGVVAGLYPALVVSGFDAVKIFKKGISGNRKSNARNALIIVQFGLSVFLSISTLAVYNQLKFMQEKRLGFDKEHTLVIEKSGVLGSQFGAFSEELRDLPGVIAVTGGSTVPGRSFGGSTFQPIGAEATERISHAAAFGDFYLPETWGLTFVAGRTFSRDHAGDSLGVIVNQALVARVGWKTPEEAIGQKIRPVFNTNAEYEIIGVVEDFHFASLHAAIEPLTIFPVQGSTFAPSIAVVRFDGGIDVPQMLSAIQSKWKAIVPEEVFEYAFLEGEFRELYGAEERLGKLFSAFALLAILIAIIGVVGLSTFMASLRTKEIGIRKVNGASVPALIVLLSIDFLKLVLVANVIFWPVTWYAIREWLKNYPYQEAPGGGIFLMTAMITSTVVLLAVVWQAAKVSFANPIKALRSE